MSLGGRRLDQRAARSLTAWAAWVAASYGGDTGVDVSYDERMDAFRFIKGAGVAATIPYFYPRMVALHTLKLEVGGPNAVVPYPPAPLC